MATRAPAPLSRAHEYVWHASCSWRALHMRALSYLLPSSLLLFVAVAASSTACSSEGASAGAAAEADSGPRPAEPKAHDPVPSDAGGDSRAHEPDAAPSGPTIALAAAADQLADALCAYYQRCWPVYITEYTGTLAGCKTGAAVALRGNYAPGALFDQAAFEAATSCLAAESCDAVYGTKFQVECAPPKPINGAPVGAECNKSNDCASGFCTGKTESACGKCAASTMMKVGDACDDATGKLCPNGSICFEKCIRVQSLGEPCNGDFTTGTLACGNGLRCVSGTCAKTGAAGSACTKSADCDPFQLQTCEKTVGQCASIQFLALGVACNTSDFASECGQGLRCITMAGSSDGTCQPPVQPGQPCTRSSSCTFGYNCRNDKCTAAGSEYPVCK